MKKTWIPYAFIALQVGLLTLVLHAPGLGLDLVNVALIYLFPILFSAVYWGLKPSVFAALLGMLAFDFLFVPPLLSFTVADLRYLLSFAVYLAVAALTSSLAARLKHQVAVARQSETHTASLYAISRQLTAVGSLDELLGRLAGQIADLVGERVHIYMRNEETESGYAVFSSDEGGSAFGEGSSAPGESELAIVGWVVRYSEPAGRGSCNLSEQAGLYMPLRTGARTYGALAVHPARPGERLPVETVRLLEALAGLAAGAIERVKLSEEAKLAQLTAESERLRTAILDSVSHELRTPLATIVGSASALAEDDAIFGPEERRDLLATIREGAMRMNRLVANLLGMVRLESGMLQLRRKWCDVEDLIGVVLADTRELRGDRPVRVEVPVAPPLPLLRGDDILLGQVLGNLVSNAVKYSPEGTGIDISVRVLPAAMRIAVADEGIGIPANEREQVFDKFYRGESARGRTGTGLGLAICKGIVEAHGGSISAEPNGERGTRMVVTLPLTAQPQGTDDDGRAAGSAGREPPAEATEPVAAAIPDRSPERTNMAEESRKRHDD
ncbi:ATP-binding protein [Cohnella sp. 56]|uniref:ATP-binding protein n=1 Tax=Cohnella sp. 56 TaxID=3113722 RepID=UPI0030E7C7DB